jgi:DNA-nicking Smr family endonuclease
MNDYKELIAFAELSESTPICDLHGATIAEAEYLVDAFLHREFTTGTRVVKVICGKGTGAILRHMRAFLKEHALIVQVESSLLPHEIGAVLYGVLEREE